MLRRLLFVLLRLHATPAHAQRRGTSLDERMRDFSRTAREETIDRVLEFFPRGGEWLWVRTVHYPGHSDRMWVRRFRAHLTLHVIDDGGVACESFLRTAEGGIAGSLMSHLMSGEWRRVDETRFIAPDAPHVFVEWRQEDGRWVILAYGDEAYEQPRLLGVAASTVQRDPVREPLRLPLPEDGHYAETEPWYTTHESLTFEGRRFTKYGLPRKFSAGEITRIASWGRVGVYAVTGATGERGELYVPVNARGEFQLYHIEHAGDSPSCR